MRHNITITIPSHSLFRDVTLCCCPLDTQPEPMWVHIYELCRLWIWTSGVTGRREGGRPDLFRVSLYLERYLLSTRRDTDSSELTA